MYNVLEDIGASVEVRDTMVSNRTTEEIIESFYMGNALESDHVYRGDDMKPSVSYYIIGSAFEGTTTPGLISDIDHMIVHEKLNVVDDIEVAKRYDQCLLIVQDSNTPAGYVKLQLVEQGVPCVRGAVPQTTSDSTLFTVDKEKRIVIRLPDELFTPGERHGPAIKRQLSGVMFTQDIVHAFRCSNWPRCASEWLTRKRYYNWPTSDCVNKCSTLGCFFVQVGHHNSDEKHLQWRVSFSLQERHLVARFTSVQLKCYILLKMVKKGPLKKLIDAELITSYHCKTCMFYMIEKTPFDFWIIENLLVCLHCCLEQILSWVEMGICPNYFIPTENMFEAWVNGPYNIKLCTSLKRILAADFSYLLEIEQDNVGNRFKESMLAKAHTLGYCSNKGLICNISLYNLVLSALVHRDEMLQWCQKNKSQGSYESLLSLKSRFLETVRVNEHSCERTKKALFLAPYVDLSMISVLIVSEWRMHSSRDMIFNALMSKNWHYISLKSDIFSAKLKQASLLHMFKYYTISLEILLPLEDRLNRCLSVCAYQDRNRKLEGLLHANISSPEELLSQYMVPCVVYLPSERKLTPFPISVEMDRSVGSPPEKKLWWYEWAIVDGKILFYFLLYLNHRALGMDQNAEADVDNIQWVINTDERIGHKETALNILGVIHNERGQMDKAIECFNESLAMKPIHNAAFLHMLNIQR